MAEGRGRILVLCIDRDNDLGEKAGVHGPVIGRAANLEAATRLALADPEDTDANSIFEGIKIFDSLAKTGEAQIATLTGHRALGYRADREISRQLERVLSEFPASSCVFVSDGADDEEVVPIISSRLRIESTRLVVMRQAKELEKTYFLLLEKLREPYYARIILGIPALVLIAFALSDMLGFGWKPVAVAIGLYLLAKGFGFEESILSAFAEFKPSIEHISFVIYLAAIPLFIISLWLGFQGYTSASHMLADPVKAWAVAIRNTLLLLPWAFLLIMAGRVTDLVREGKRFEAAKYILYITTVLLLWLLFTVASDWVMADRYFSDFVTAVIISIVIAFISVEVTKRIRASVAASMRLENKEVLTEAGTYIGRIVGVDRKRGMLIVQTSLGQRLTYSLERIAGIGERVIVRR
ncbi:MAG: DUF373 family protein [Candidatus Micrarchaeia archaeon]